jgi:hypothetical protein
LDKSIEGLSQRAIVKINSKLGADELLARLKEGSEPEPWLYLTDVHSADAVIGSFNGYEFRLCWNHAHNYKPYFYGRIENNQDGSEIVGEFKFRKSILIINRVIFWMAILFVSFLAFILLITLVKKGRLLTQLLPFLFFGVGGSLWINLLPQMGWEKDKDSIPFIIEFLNDCAGNKK